VIWLSFMTTTWPYLILMSLVTTLWVDVYTSSRFYQCLHLCSHSKPSNQTGCYITSESSSQKFMGLILANVSFHKFPTSLFLTAATDPSSCGNSANVDVETSRVATLSNIFERRCKFYIIRRLLFGYIVSVSTTADILSISSKS
jgi:hypothetical protein